MLSISTDKNQCTKVHGVLYIPTKEYNYKVITGCDIILQADYITRGCKSNNTRRFTSINNTKEVNKLQKANSGAE